MGKYALLITIAAVLGVILLSSQARDTALKTSEDQVERQEEILARQIARSGFNVGLSAIRSALEDQDANAFNLPSDSVDYEGESLY